MAAPCNNCLFYDKQYDDMRQEYDDIIVVGNNQPLKHFCVQYEGGIPTDIFYGGSACKFFIEK